MRVVIIVLGLIYAGCVSAVPRQNRIVGGEETTIEKYPFMAGLLGPTLSGGFYQACGGTLITRTAVVSAGHCFRNLALAANRVRLGSTYASSGGTVHLLSRITVHELFNETLQINDVAVVRLSVPAMLSDKIKTARIAGPNYRLPTNTVVDLIGWGDIADGGNASEILRHVELKIIDQQICAERHASLNSQPDIDFWPEVTSDMVCSGILDVGGKDSCQGDSGGPVIRHQDVLVAIISWGYICADPFYPGVNVRVSSYTNWIYTHSTN